MDKQELILPVGATRSEELAMAAVAMFDAGANTVGSPAWAVVDRLGMTRIAEYLDGADSLAGVRSRLAVLVEMGWWTAVVWPDAPTMAEFVCEECSGVRYGPDESAGSWEDYGQLCIYCHADSPWQREWETPA